MKHAYSRLSLLINIPRSLCSLPLAYITVTKLQSHNSSLSQKQKQRALMTSYKKYEVRIRNPNPNSSALLVIDMQNIFSTIAKSILTPLKTTINLCRRASIPVIYTRHIHKSPAESRALAEWWGDESLIVDGTHDAELLPEVSPGEGEVVVEKSTYGAFTGTQLEKKLLEMGIEEVIVTGVMTNLCCETSAREAFVRGFRVFFSTDATATSCVELHEATLMNMAYGFAYLVDCTRLEDALFGTSGHNLG